ncbi:hypothetical protein [Paenibacillus sp. FSL E2-0151]|uniref:BC1872 family protein n=1 Tax=Paenibacillus sp. FSL E2-0151 TaxID=2921357 RepID=UPI0030ED5C28
MTQTALTREQVLMAKPGDHLDLLVAINVMGFEPSNQRSGWVRIGALATYPKRYSTDISAAWEVLNKMIYFGMEVNVGFYEKWDCALDYNGTNWCEQAETAPEAICKAALLAVLDL